MIQVWREGTLPYWHGAPGKAVWIVRDAIGHRYIVPADALSASASVFWCHRDHLRAL